MRLVGPVPTTPTGLGGDVEPDLSHCHQPGDDRRARPDRLDVAIRAAGLAHGIQQDVQPGAVSEVHPAEVDGYAARTGGHRGIQLVPEPVRRRIGHVARDQHGRPIARADAEHAQPIAGSCPLDTTSRPDVCPRLCVRRRQLATMRRNSAEVQFRDGSSSATPT